MDPLTAARALLKLSQSYEDVMGISTNSKNNNAEKRKSKPGRHDKNRNKVKESLQEKTTSKTVDTRDVVMTNDEKITERKSRPKGCLLLLFSHDKMCVCVSLYVVVFMLYECFYPVGSLHIWG